VDEKRLCIGTARTDTSTKPAWYIKCADRCGELAPVNSFVGLSGGDQVAFPDHLLKRVTT
jgi:hypothetical protein